MVAGGGLGHLFLINQRYKPVSYCTLGLTNRNRWPSLQRRDGSFVWLLVLSVPLRFIQGLCEFSCVSCITCIAIANRRFHNPVRAWVDWLCPTLSWWLEAVYQSFQLPNASKNHRGLDSDWLVSLNTFSQNPLILKLELFRSKSVSDMDFPIISENWVCRFLANYLLDIMQCKLEMAWGFFRTPISD